MKVSEILRVLEKVDKNAEIFYRTDHGGETIAIGMVAIDDDGDVALYDTNDMPCLTKILKRRSE